MALSWIQVVLDMAFETPSSSGQEVYQYRTAQTDLLHGCRESYLGRSAHPRQLTMLGFNLSERTVLRWMQRAPRSPEQAKRWAAFLSNHREAIAAMDFFTVPTMAFECLSTEHPRSLSFAFLVRT